MAPPEPPEGTTFLVFDLGGGTFDVSLIRMTDQSVEVLIGRRRSPARRRRLGRASCSTTSWTRPSPSAAMTRCGTTRRCCRTCARWRRRPSRISVCGRDQDAHRAATPEPRPRSPVTRAQFEEMTADLLDETIRDHRADAGRGRGEVPRHPRARSASVLLVGGSSLDARRGRGPAEENSAGNPKLADPDLAVAKGAALYAACETVRYAETETSPAGRGCQ